jgi:hypothetical protein
MKRIWILSFLCLVVRPLVAQIEAAKLGDVADGNRSVPVHRIDMIDADSAKIRPGDQPLMPFSTKNTCDPCHSYATIKQGLHFNSLDKAVPAGRPGEPWMRVDYATATQIPVSYRAWEGTWHPTALNMTHMSFLDHFGRHLPGGGPGEAGEQDPPELIMRWLISGDLEINCMSCHAGHPEHDQSEYAAQVMRQNYRWAATASSAFAEVHGTAKSLPDYYDIYSGGVGDDPYSPPPSVEYYNGIFNSQNKVFFDLVRDIPDQRCYFCHSAKYNSRNKSERWHFEEDVHLKSGIGCVDCHRHGLDHKMLRGYEGEAEELNDPHAIALTCEGCHLPAEDDNRYIAGRLGAPVPLHKGLPVIHFEKLSCTACHSGPLPEEWAMQVKTSRSHALGVHGAPKDSNAAPYIIAPVFAQAGDGKIYPQKMVYPAFWARLANDELDPVDPQLIQPLAMQVIQSDTLTDSLNIDRLNRGVWPQFSEKQVITLFHKIAQLDSNDKRLPVYVTGGKVFFAADSAHLDSKTHPLAEPYKWPFAHAVRPASQSLGAKSCNDCHSLDAPFQFGKIRINTALDLQEPLTRSMLGFQMDDVLYPRLFALSFLVRPWLKLFLSACLVVLLIIISVFVLKGADRLLKIVGSKKW